MAAQTSAGTTIHISSSLPASYDQAGYDALSDFDAIGEVESIGEFGTEYNEVTFTALDNRRVRKFKGSYNPGTIQISAALDGSDAGQAAAEAALDSDADVSFKVTLQNGAIKYFSGKVMSYTTNVSSVDNITMSSINIGINTDIVAVAAP